MPATSERRSTSLLSEPDRPTRHATPPRGAAYIVDADSTHWRLTLLLVALTVISAANFIRVYDARSWVAPVLLAALTAHGLSVLTRRSRWHPLLSILVVLAGVVMVSAWTIVPGTTWHGLPLKDSWESMGTALQQAQTAFPRSVAPAPPLAGFVLLSAWGVGLMAALADWASFRLRSAFHGAAPGLAVFLVCCVLGTAQYRLLAVALEVLALGAFVLAHRASIGTTSVAWFRRDDSQPAQRGVGEWAASVGAGLLAVTVVVTMAAVGVFSGPDGVAILGWKHPGGVGATPTRITPSPLVDLRPRLLNNSNVVVFTVDSPVPSYWRLTSLDHFNGQVWSSDDSYNTVGGELPGITSTPPGTRRVTEVFNIDTLDSIWLPSAFNPEQVSGVPGVSYDPRSGSLITPRPTTNGLDYRVESLRVLNQLDAARLNKATPVDRAALASDLQLPSLPNAVVRLARRIVAGRKTEYQKALALEEFFHQPQFHYSLKVSSSSSTDALEDFLFRTHTGYCQQYAGAYAVLARIDGLPTRVAVGFTSGTEVVKGFYQVTDADAHAWPEVHFGGIGWVPFEPTPGRVIPNAERYTRQATPHAGNVAPKTTSQEPQRNNLGNSSAATPRSSPHLHQLAPQGGGVAGATKHGGHSHHLTLLVLLLVALGLGVAGWMATVAGLRTYRRWRNRVRVVEPDRRVLAAWNEVCDTLAWWRLRRRPDLTYTEFAQLVDERMDLLFGHYRVEDACSRANFDRIGSLATAAEYAPEHIRPEDGDWALSWAKRFEDQLWVAAPWRRRLRRRFDPGPLRPKRSGPPPLVEELAAPRSLVGTGTGSN